MGGTCAQPIPAINFAQITQSLPCDHAPEKVHESVTVSATDPSDSAVVRDTRNEVIIGESRESKGSNNIVLQGPVVAGITAMQEARMNSNAALQDPVSEGAKETKAATNVDSAKEAKLINKVDEAKEAQQICTVNLQEIFHPSEMKAWPSSRFNPVSKMEDAHRNHGQVHRMWDTEKNRSVAVKQMPNTWMRSSHADFLAQHPDESEFPWQDIGCLKFLNSRNFRFACDLYGVYKDDKNTFVVTSLASEGDLFSWCSSPLSKSLPAGPEREAFIKPLAVQLMSSVRQLHELSIVHRDISMENFVISRAEDACMHLKIIDFGMASTERHYNCVRGKSMYIAPELHKGKTCDFFLSDAFSVGVTLYALLLQEYPWNYTTPGSCQRWEYVRKSGFHAYSARRKVRNTTKFLKDLLSEDLMNLLAGLLEPDPSKRLTLGETAWQTDSKDSVRRSVWDETWLHGSGTLVAV